MRVVAAVATLGCLGLTAPAFGQAAHFESGKSALGIPFELVANRIILPVSVNGSPPLFFILDTGASRTVLSLRKAQLFGMTLQRLGKVEGGIRAEPPEAYLIADKVSFALPGVTLSGQVPAAFALDAIQQCLDPVNDGTTRVVDGVLGNDFFGNFVVEIDYAARLVHLHDPASYRYTGQGKILQLEIDPPLGLVRVRAQVKAGGFSPVTARLVVDTGAGALSLAKQFAEAHKLLPPAQNLTPATECGIGAADQEATLMGPLEALQLGDSELPNPLTVFYKQTPARGYDGLLGGAALRNFKVIFDYSRSRMILEPPS